MKNIHLLPTDKPSRLCFVIDTKESTLTLFEDSMEKGKRFFPQNIYITNSEEIKEGDWVFDIFKNAYPVIRQLTTKEEVLGVQKTELKIILTTNVDLIEDGVQAIDDEFLEWFVENPSCERVYVEKEKINLGYVSGTTYVDFNYKIIIPQSLVGRKIIGFKFQEKNEFHWWREEMEKYIGVVGQITGVSMDCIDVVVKFANDDTIYRYPFELINKHLVNDDKIKPKQSTKDRIFSETSEETKQKARDYANSLITKLNMTSKETLEEVAERIANNFEEPSFKAGVLYGIIEGAKWQQERMYSEEDIIKFGKYITEFDNLHKEKEFVIKQLFEEFKNK